MKIHTITAKTRTAAPASVDETVAFLHEHLDEFRDDPESIRNAIEHAVGESGGDGFVLQAVEDGALAGAVVVNRTGMDGYVPPNFLVYIAVHRDHRGKGLGKRLMRTAMDAAGGPVSLHVEYDNPAKKLYEALGFTSKYAEMRYDPDASASAQETHARG